MTPSKADIDIAALEHKFIGKTWATNDDGAWLLPEKTLGWQIAAWCADYLNAPNGGPWKFTLEQLRFVLWWYAVDATGRFVYRTGVLQRMKGWGKDPLLAVLCLVELCGPCRFGGWAADGSPIAVPEMNAWVQVTAVNQAQTRNTMAMLPSLITDKMRSAYAIKDGAEVVRANGGRQRLEAVTSNYRAIEGKRTTFIVLNETHHWVEGNHGHQMFETIDGNATKIMGARYLAITNAYLPGEDSVAERMREAWERVDEGIAASIGFYYDSIEAHPSTPLTPEALEIVVPIIRGDAVWLDVPQIIQSVQNTQIAPSRSRRMYLNQIVAEEDALYGPDQWAELMDSDLMLNTGDEIVLGFDGSRTDDATALVAVRVKDSAAFLLHLQEKPQGPAGDDWHVNQERVDSAVHEAFRLYRPVGFYADVKDWESYIDDWAESYRERLTVKASQQHAVAWDMRQSLKRVTLAHERLMQAVFDKRIKHQGDKALTRHVMNTRRRPNNYGISFGKESRESSRKVDAYAALMLAHEALHDFRTRGKIEKPRSGAVWAF